MQAVILAAGMGKRLKELTQNNTKCMVKVNGVTLIDRMLHQIERKNVSQIIIVVGYEGQKLIDYIQTLGIQTPIQYVNNPVYDKTNNIYSLSLAQEYLKQDDTILFESDLIFEDAVLDELMDDPRDTLALVDKYESWMDGTCVKLLDDDTIEAFVPGKKFKFKDAGEYYKTVNIYKFSRHFSEAYYVPFLTAYEKALGENEYYEQVLRVITILDKPVIKVKRLSGQKWYEIDDIQDLDIAESIFAPDGDKRVNLLQERSGGYWRYPKLLNFSHPVNPYFPPQRMMDEIKASFETLMTKHPSSTRVVTLLAAKNFGLSQENIAVGNGASTLTKLLARLLKEPIGLVMLPFTESQDQCWDKESIMSVPERVNCQYTADDIITYYDQSSIHSLILTNPDNLNGNYIPKKDLQKLVSWTASKKIQLIVDESFADFADEAGNTLLQQGILEQNPHLGVIKSFSASCGVPGLRLGVFASGDQKLVAAVKSSAAKWDINSYAEFYLQIEEKYRTDYRAALEKLRSERSWYMTELAAINGLRVFPSQANFVVVEIEAGIPAGKLLKKLLIKHDLLIQELPGNKQNYVRLGVRNREENEILLTALRKELEKRE